MYMQQAQLRRTVYKTSDSGCFAVFLICFAMFPKDSGVFKLRVIQLVRDVVTEHKSSYLYGFTFSFSCLYKLLFIITGC